MVAIFMGIFILSATTVSRVAVGNYVVRGLGAILGLAYVIRSLRARMRPSPEMILYICWIAWSLTGLVGARSSVMYWMIFWTVVQVWLMITIISGLTETRRMLSFNLIMFIIGALVVAGYSYVTGEYRVAREEGERVAGLAVNANTFAWLLLLAVACMAYFWQLPTRAGLLKYAIVGLAMAGASVAIVLSGSRKAIIALAAFYILWLLFCYPREIARKPALLLVILLIFTVGAYGFISLVSQTVAGERLGQTWDFLSGRTLHGGGSVRLQLYEDGVRIFLNNPIRGVGLMNFRFFSTSHHVAHSEYVEILCDTGLPGFVLYFSIFVVLWRRAGKIIRYSDDPQAIRTAKLLRALLVVVMLMNFGRWNFTSKPAWIVFGSFIGYTHAVWRDIQYRMSPETQQGYAYA